MDLKPAASRLESLHRRNFHKLSLSALGGLMAGVAAGCSRAPEAPSTAKTQGPGTDAAGEMAAQSPLLSEPHVCRGLNTCRGQGKSGENACAGQGQCATVAAHECAGQNACQGQGGCGTNPGENACKGQGGCAVPLMDAAWTKARSRFEQLMQVQGQDVGAAPAPSA